MSAVRRVVMVGTGTALGPAVLRALLGSRHGVAAVVTAGPLPAPRGRVLLGADVVDVARAAGIPVHGLARGDGGRLVQELRPEVVVVSCFPWKLPPPWWTTPALAVNVHPSLLPRWRGPSPLFWQYRAGDPGTGVTVHHLSGTLDAGPVAAQAAVPLDDDLDLEAAESRLGRVGGDLVVALLDAGTVPRREQGDGGSAQGWPDDFTLPETLGAREAYRFVKLVGRTTPLRAGGWCVRDARGHSASPPPPGQPAVGCRDGWLLLGPADAHPAR